MKKMRTKFKKGAASFYIVAFSTLILLIVATSFAAVIISEITRTSNDDLSQSAYDSALAGIEDAKLAYFNYQNCVSQNATASAAKPTGELNCPAIMYYVENADGQQDCDMVARVLGRVGLNDEEGGEVTVQESSNAGNNMQQAYTCVKMQTVLKDYRSTLSSTNQTKVVKVKFDEPAKASAVDRVKISWYETGDNNYQFTNMDSEGKVVFPQLGTTETATPPTISVAMVQTAEQFNFSDFDMTVGEATDRGMVYLVPTSNTDFASRSVDNNYRGTWTGTENVVNKNAFLKSNDKTTVNLPYAVYCDPNSDAEFACSATIELPEPIGGVRNDDTFMFVVSLPYGKPTADFAMEFLCSGDNCGKEVSKNGGESEVVDPGQAYLDGVQVEVDSTGRANDLYRRVKVRLESEANSSYLSVMGPLELLGDNGNSDILKKIDAVTSEWNFE